MDDETRAAIRRLEARIAELESARGSSVAPVISSTVSDHERRIKALENQGRG